MKCQLWKVSDFTLLMFARQAVFIYSALYLQCIVFLFCDGRVSRFLYKHVGYRKNNWSQHFSEVSPRFIFGANAYILLRPWLLSLFTWKWVNVECVLLSVNSEFTLTDALRGCWHWLKCQVKLELNFLPLSMSFASIYFLEATWAVLMFERLLIWNYILYYFEHTDLMTRECVQIFIYLVNQLISDLSISFAKMILSHLHYVTSLCNTEKY